MSITGDNYVDKCKTLAKKCYFRLYMAKDRQLGLVGRLGEDVAVKYLKAKGLKIVDRNATYKFGEIDIVALNDGVYHFVEVKAMDVNSAVQIKLSERLSRNKLARIKKAVQQYVLVNNLYRYQPQIDLVMIELDQTNKLARVKMIEHLS